MRKLAALSMIVLLLLACAAFRQSSGVPSMGSTWQGASAAGIAVVQHFGRNQSTSATTVTWSVGTVTSGNWLVAVGLATNTGSLACSDTLGNSFTASAAAGTPEQYYCYAHITSAGGADSITVTTSSNNGGTNFSLELSGVGGFDVAGTPSTSFSGTTWTFPTITTTHANDIVIAFGGNESTNNTSFVAGSGYTIPSGTCGNNVSAACGIGSGGNQSGMIEYQIVTTATSYTPTATLTTMTGGGNTISFHP